MQYKKLTFFASATWQNTFPVAGSSTGIVDPSWESTHSLLIKSCKQLTNKFTSGKN